MAEVASRSYWHLVLSRSMSTWERHLNKLGKPHTPTLHTNSKGNLPSGSGEDFLKGFNHIWT